MSCLFNLKKFEFQILLYSTCLEVISIYKVQSENLVKEVIQIESNLIKKHFNSGHSTKHIKNESVAVEINSNLEIL